MDNWPPPYTLKKNPRARHIKLRASPRHGLELIVPLRFNEKYLTELLEINKSWIIKKLSDIKTTPSPLPLEINLFAIQQIWPIHYIKSHSKKLELIIRPEKELVLLGNTDNSTLCKKTLIQWLKTQASLHLKLSLQKLSEKTQLRYRTVTIRGQESRWGSCTSQKSISLNYKLLFLPPHLVEHILIHELCHTRHLNHSPKFWQLVASFDPLWKQHSREARLAKIPEWISHF